MRILNQFLFNVIFSCSMSASTLILHCSTPVSDISLSGLSFVLHLLNHIFRYAVFYIYIYQIFWLLVSRSHCTYPTMLGRSHSYCSYPTISASTVIFVLPIPKNWPVHWSSYFLYPTISASTLLFVLPLRKNLSQYAALHISLNQTFSQYTALRIKPLQQFRSVRCPWYYAYPIISPSTLIFALYLPNNFGQYAALRIAPTH